MCFLIFVSSFILLCFIPIYSFVFTSSTDSFVVVVVVCVRISVVIFVFVAFVIRMMNCEYANLNTQRFSLNWVWLANAQKRWSKLYCHSNLNKSLRSRTNIKSIVFWIELGTLEIFSSLISWSWTDHIQVAHDKTVWSPNKIDHRFHENKKINVYTIYRTIIVLVNRRIIDNISRLRSLHARTNNDCIVRNVTKTK